MARRHVQHVLDDEHLQQQILGWVRKYGVYEFTGFSKSTGKRFKKMCYDGIVSGPTFYGYFKKNPDFKTRCEEAKKYFKQTLFVKDPELRQEYIDKLTRLGKEGFIRIKKKKCVKKDATGNIISVEETVEEDVMPPPHWAVRMLLGKLSHDDKEDEHAWMES